MKPGGGGNILFTREHEQILKILNFLSGTGNTSWRRAASVLTDQPEAPPASSAGGGAAAQH